MTARPFIHMHDYRTPSARQKEKLRVLVAIALANEKGLRPIVRIPAETRRKAT